VARKPRAKAKAEALSLLGPAPAAAAAGPELSDSLPAPLLKFLAAALLGLTLYLALSGRGPKPALPQAPAKATEWGPELKPQALLSFDEEGDVWDMKAAKDGSVYALLSGELRMYRDGKLAKSLAFASSPARSLALENGRLYVSDYQGSVLGSADPALERMASLNLLGAPEKVLALAGFKGALFGASLDAATLFEAEAGGRVLKSAPGPRSASGGGFALDLQADSEGRLFLNDTNGAISVYGPKLAPLGSFACPCAPARRERIALLNGRAYINCFNQERVFVSDAKGSKLGYFAAKQPQMICAGQDGFLYLQSAGKILKFADPLGAKP
jgi:hypothetical protein